MSYFIIYLAGISEALTVILFLLGMSCAIMGGMAVFSTLEEGDWGYSGVQRLRKFFYIGITILFIQALIPSKETLVAMVTIPPVVEYVQNSEELHELPDNVVKFINDYLTENSKAKN